MRWQGVPLGRWSLACSRSDDLAKAAPRQIDWAYGSEKLVTAICGGYSVDSILGSGQ